MSAKRPRKNCCHGET